MEFANNNNESASSSMTPFFLNKGFHPRINFSPDETDYDIIKKKIDSAKAKDITVQIEDLLNRSKERLLASQQRIVNQANKKRKDKSYRIGD